MRRPAFLAAAAITALLALYIAFVASRAIALLGSESLVGKALGAAFMVLPVVAVWYLINEWRMGMAVQRMRDRLEAEGRLPLWGEGAVASRLSEEQAQDVYEVARRDVELEPQDWGAWYRLAFAYDALRDKPQARKALRYAAELFRRG